ncbi:MAG: hypothetical protein WD398_00470 [Cyclobacteriaceae bacterium]
MNRSTTIEQLIHLQEKGSFSALSFPQHTTISKLDKNGFTKWERDLGALVPANWITKIFNGKNAPVENGYLVSSADGNTAFFIEMKIGLLGKGNALVTHFDAEGNSRQFDFQDERNIMGSTLHATFCDNTYLYFLTSSKNFTDVMDMEAPSLSYILNRFRIEDFRYERILLDLPQQNHNKFSSHWSFIGQKEQEKFMVLKSILPGKNTVQAKVVSFDPDGNHVRNFELEFTPENNHIRPSFHVKKRNWNAMINTDHDYYQSGHRSISNHYLNYTIGAFFNVFLDENSGDFYLSGLLGENDYGSNPLQYKNQNYSNFFVSRFDPLGNLIWDVNPTENLTDLSSFDFVKKYPPAYKHSHLVLIPSLNLLNFNIQVKDHLLNFAINNQGQLLESSLKVNHTDAVDSAPHHPKSFVIAHQKIGMELNPGEPVFKMIDSSGPISMKGPSHKNSNDRY